MTPRLVFRPEAEAELLDARDWYEAQRVGLGAVFAAAVETTVTAILESPLAYPRVKGEAAKATRLHEPTTNSARWCQRRPVAGERGRDAGLACCSNNPGAARKV